MDFLGNEYMLVACDKCSIVFEAMSIDKINKTCPSCANPDPLEEYKDPDGCNCYSCMSGRAMKKAINDKSK